MRIRPCIDIHNGKVKQIVGGTLHEERQGEILPIEEKKQSFSGKQSHIPGHVPGEKLTQSSATENFVSEYDADYFASIYCEKNLPGGHIILLNSRTSEPEMYEE